MKADNKVLTVRFPPVVLEQIKAIAKANNRSLNGEIITALEEHIKQQQQKGT